jgi:hypothetical protein
MRPFALSPARKLQLASAAVALLSLACIPSHAQPDPPAEAGRISYITGNVSIQPVGSNDWGQAVPNLPLGPGDRIFTDFNSRAEIQVGQTFVRIGPNSDVSLVDSTPGGLYFGIAQGSIHLHTQGLWQGQSVYVNTPSGSSVLSTPGELRVDVMPDESAAIFTDFNGYEQITGADEFSQGLDDGQALELVGSNPVVPQWLQPADWDSLDNWSHQRDQQIFQAISYRYLSPEIPGGYEMDAAGTWMPGTPYGAVWFPNNVPGGWAPYHYGHWVNHAPWGWVWVEDEPWGYAPFHYGRWVSLNGRWGWIPGPPAAHPVWSPALVVFAGGVPGVSAWFPLGPGEPYWPWYPCSPHYIDVVNISNITVTNVVHVQTTYVNFNFGAVVFANRAIGVTAINNADFAAGRPAAQVSVAVNVHVFDRVQVLAAPEPRPTPQSFIGRPPVRPVTVSVVRPVLINEKGLAVSATPGARPVPPPVKPAPQVRALPGRVAIAPPPNAPPSGPGRPQPGPNTPSAPMYRTAPAATPIQPAYTPKPVPPPVNRPIAPAAPVPAVKPTPEPEFKAPPPPVNRTPSEPNGKPPAPQVTKPAGEPAPPPKVVKPNTPPPPKTDKDKDKNKKDEKDKEKE